MLHSNIFCIFYTVVTLLQANNIRRPPFESITDPFRESQSARIGDFPFPTNPMNDRARGYILQGKAQSALANYGNYIDIEVNPNGAWGDYSYLYEVTFLAGIPGQSYTSNYIWHLSETIVDEEGFPKYSIWESQDAYAAWYANGDTNFVGILYDADNDFGRWEPDSISRKFSTNLITDGYQWVLDDEQNKLFLSTMGEWDPNKSTSRIGFIYPWALRPELVSREEQFDLYDYGPDNEEWTKDDRYFYYGANTAESCLTYYNPSYNTDWQPVSMARINSHNTEVSAGELFGNTYVTDPGDTYPLLAHSGYSQT
ncbi:MAG: hypothetical protein QF769_07730, partial [Candidatus Marinimicrobia bacterium]|nr:hypothetical protein [Candidatus Neomarinimicrobiota bacterium]